MFVLLTLNVFHTFSSVSIVDFKQVNLAGIILGVKPWLNHKHSLMITIASMSF